jgi:serine/threonine-protein kinase
VNTQRYRQVKALAETVLDLSSEARTAELERVVADDAELRTEIEALLNSIEAAEAGAFLGASPDIREAVIADAGERSYRILRELGRGGMGTVYLADRADGEYRQQVALKTLNVEAGRDPFLIERLRSERQILAQLQHPNIARLLDGGSDAAGRPFLAMEYVDGERIDRWCERHALAIRARIELFLQICDAVQYAHGQLVIHRDLKPGNILVAADGRPKLLDFGIARLIDPNEATGTATTDRLLTFRYASPEQIRGERVGTASDLYSLAIVLYCLLTGRLPYANRDAPAPELARAVLDDAPRTPSRSITAASADPDGREIDAATLARELSGDIDAILLRALRKEPGERYASVAQFADDLRRHLDGLPVLARQGQRGYALRKFVARHRWPVLASAFALLTLVAFAISLATQLERTRIERDRANRVAAFFSDMFEDSNPLGDVAGDSRERAQITVREVLDREAPRIERELADQPEVQATLLGAIGRVYEGLDQRDKAQH